MPFVDSEMTWATDRNPKHNANGMPHCLWHISYVAKVVYLLSELFSLANAPSSLFTPPQVFTLGIASDICL